MVPMLNLLPKSSWVVRKVVGFQIVWMMPTVATRTATVTTSLVASDVPSSRRMMNALEQQAETGRQDSQGHQDREIGAGQPHAKRICQ